MSKYLRYLEVISYSYSVFLGFPPLRFLSSYAVIFPSWAFIFPNPLCSTTKSHVYLLLFYSKESHKAALHSLNFQKELIKNLLCARNSCRFFIKQKSIPLGAYFGVMQTIKVKILCKQI